MEKSKLIFSGKKFKNWMVHFIQVKNFMKYFIFFLN